MACVYRALLVQYKVTFARNFQMCRKLKDGLQSKLKYVILMCFQIVDVH